LLISLLFSHFFFAHFPYHVAARKPTTQEGSRAVAPAIYMIVSGQATVSVKTRMPGGAVIDAVMTVLKAPNYFGEDTVSQMPHDLTLQSCEKRKKADGR
jgi:hypothetical protein